jgi:polyhydroxybutyrate depolymerase
MRSSWAPLPVFLAFGSALVLASAGSAGCGSDGTKPSTSSTSSTSSSGGSAGDSGASSSTSSSGNSGTSGGAEPPALATVTVTNESMTSGGAKRTYVLVVPKTYDAARAYPLVMVFHGQPGTAVAMHQFHPFEVASQQEAVLVYPDGTNLEWNLTGPTAVNADMQFVKALVDEVASKVSIDKTRVFGDGYSNGGFMVNQLACRLGLFKAIASHAGGAPYEPPETGPARYPNGYVKCAADVRTPAIVLHGEADGVVTPDSGEFDAMYWAYVNGCAATRSATTPSPCTTYDGCPAGKPVVWCSIPSLGHLIWSNGAAAAWAFFSSLP